MHREGARRPPDRRIGLRQGTNAAHDLRIGALSDEEPFALIGEEESGRRQNQADDQRGPSDERGAMKEVAEEDSEESDQQAEQGGGIFEQDGEERRILARPDRLPDPLPGLRLLPKLAGSDPPGKALDYGRQAED